MMYNTVQKTIMSYDWILQMHGFYVDTDKKEIIFDIIMSFEIETNEGISIIEKEIAKLYPDYKITIVADVAVSD